MAGHHPPAYVRGTNPLPIPKAPLPHRFLAKALGATMTFWILYRAKSDWPIWCGLKKPWELHH